jgi:hypothetical protein
MVAKASFVSLCANEIIIIDNQSWISIHVCVCDASMDKSTYPSHIATCCLR